MTSPTPSSFPDRVYDRLLRVYPRGFRARFAVGMRDLFSHRRAEIAGRGWVALLRFWVSTVLHVMMFGTIERITARISRGTRPRGAGRFSSSTPPYRTPTGNGIMTLLESVLRDIVYATRSLLRRPGTSFLAVVTFALGIGASTALFSVVDSVLLRPLPYPDPESLVSVYPTSPALRGHPTMGHLAERATFSWPEIADVREHQRSFVAVAAYGSRSLTVSGDGRPERIRAGEATYELFGLLGTSPLVGRLFTPTDDNRTGERIIVLSESYWRDRFGGDPSMVGRAIRVNDEPYTVVGVLPEAFYLTGYENTQAWVPLAGTASDGQRGNHGGMTVIARLNPGVHTGRARDDVFRILQETAPPDHGEHGANVFSRQEDETRNVRPTLIGLIAAALVLLAVACGNVAALMLGTGIERERELAVRTALGASRARVARQLLTESVLLAGLGALGGIGLATVSMDLLLSLAPSGVPRIEDAGINGNAVLFAIVVSLGSGVLFGQIPAWALSQTDASQTLRSSRGAVEGRVRLQSAVVVGEFTLATVLLISGALLTRTLVELNRVDLGFDPDNLLSVSLALPYQRFAGDDRPALDNYVQRIVDEVETLPGVGGVAVTSNVPLSGDRGNNDVGPEGWDNDRDGVLIAERRFVSTNYFDVLRNPLVEGRTFDRRDDRTDAAPAVIISESLARRAWPEESAVGKGFRFWGRDNTVVGVVRDVRDEGMEVMTELAFYVPARQMGPQQGSLLVRTEGDPIALVPTLRDRIWSADPNLPIISMLPMTERIGNAVAEQRYRARLMSVFAVLAGLFAVLGTYGVTARTVAQRTREMGIRLALGAERGRVMSVVIGQGIRLAVIGAALGIVASLAAGRLLANMLFGVTFTDPVTLGGIALLVTLASIAASTPPSYRATRVDPMVALRGD